MMLQSVLMSECRCLFMLSILLPVMSAHPGLADALLFADRHISRVVSQLVVQQHNCIVRRLSDGDNIANASVHEILL